MKKLIKIESKCDKLPLAMNNYVTRERARRGIVQISWNGRT